MTDDGDVLLGHAGADPGASAFVALSLRTGTIAAAFTNRNFVSEQDYLDFGQLVIRLARIGAQR